MRRGESRHGRRPSVVLLSVLLSSGAIVAPAQAERIIVTVLGEGDRPVAGARVSAWTRDGARLVPVTSSEPTESDEEGRAILDDVPPRALVSVTARGYLRAAEPADAGAGAMTIRLERGRSVRIAVADADTGAPVTDFTTLIVPVDPPRREDEAFIAEGIEPQSLHTRDGSAVVHGLPPGEPVMLIVRASGRAPAVLPVLPDAESVSVQLTSRGCDVWTVVDDRSGSPLAGARAAASAELLEGPLSRLALAAESDESGRMTVCSAPGRPQPMIVTHDEYAPAVVPVGQEDGAGASAGPDGVVRLDPGGSIGGIVLDRDGQPVQGARVTVRPADERLPRRLQQTGRDGRFQFDRIPAGAVELEVEVAEDGGDHRLIRRRLDVAREETAELEIRLDRRVALRVVRGDEPLVGVRAVVLDGADRPEPIAAAITDAEGIARLELDSRPRPNQLVAIVSERNVSYLHVPQPDGDEAEDAPLTIRLPSVSVHGVVEGAPNDEPIAGATVLCRRGGRTEESSEPGPLWVAAAGRSILADRPVSLAYTDARGRFVLDRPAWCETIAVSGPPPPSKSATGWRPATVRVARIDPEEDLEIVLEPVPRLEVRVAVRGAPPRGPIVVSARRPGAPGDVYSTSAEGGVARLELLDAGPWVVIARAQGKAPAVRGPIEIRPGPAEPIEMELTDGAYLTVEVGSEGDLAAAVALIDGAGLDVSTIVERQPSAGGDRVTFGPLRLGRYEVRAGERRVRVDLRKAGEVDEVSLLDR